MPDYDPQISNGTCYYQDGEEANPRYIPCGNSALGVVPCCESGNVCLSSRACYDGHTYVTYLAGCTDPNYDSDNCPHKGPYSNQSWVGLSYCDKPDKDSRLWVGCPLPQASFASQDLAIVASVPSSSCSCPTTSQQPLFTDAGHLADYITLPASTGMTITWGGGLSTNPYQTSTSVSSSSMSIAAASSSSTSTSRGSAAASSTSRTSSSASISSSTSSMPTPTAASTSTHMSTGSIAGAAAGGAIAFLVLLGLFSALMQRYYRKKRETAAFQGAQEKQDRPESTAYTDDVLAGDHAHGGLPSPSYKSELPADSVISPHTSMQSPSTRFSEFGSVQSEMEGSPAIGSNGRPVHNGGYEMPGHRGTYYEMSA